MGFVVGFFFFWRKRGADKQRGAVAMGRQRRKVVSGSRAEGRARCWLPKGVFYSGEGYAASIPLLYGVGAKGSARAGAGRAEPSGNRREMAALPPPAPRCPRAPARTPKAPNTPGGLPGGRLLAPLTLGSSRSWLASSSSSSRLRL